MTQKGPMDDGSAAIDPRVAAVISAVPPELNSPLFRHWTLREAIAPKPFSFSKDDRVTLCNVLAAAKVTNAVDDVLKALEAEVGEYRSWHAQEDNRVTQSSRRKQLDGLAGSISTFCVQLKALDYDTRQDVAASMTGLNRPSEKPLADFKPREMEDLEIRLCAAFNQLAQLERDIRNYLSGTPRSSGGRRKRYTAARLAVDVGFALSRSAGPGFPVTSVRDGPFEQVLAISLAATYGAPVKDVHDHAMAAVKEIKRRKVEKPGP